MTISNTIPFWQNFKIPLRNGLNRPKSVRGSGTKMVNMGELFSYGRIFNIEMDRVLLNERETESFLLEAGDLLFARQSLVLSGAGKCSIFLGDKESVTFESHIIRARLDKGKVDPAFFYYFFGSSLGRTAIESIVEQVAAAGIRGSDLAKLDVPLIPLDTQSAIVSLLGALDDKIELNRQMNETLEATARLIFKDWFVDFGPTRAKAEGRLAYLAPELWSLFPDALDDDDKPVGWKGSTIGESFRLLMGQSPPGETYNDNENGLPFFQGRTDFGIRYPKRRIFLDVQVFSFFKAAKLA
jgi:type I restriction enzyme S subunit